MAQVADIVDFLQEFAPLELAEQWDNVGLLIGSPRHDVRRVMTCLTLTPDVASEAIRRGDNLVVTHHPVLFRAVQRLTDETVEGRMLLELIGAQISVYSPHTAFDSAADGINQHLAEALGLRGIRPLRQLGDGAAESAPPTGEISDANAPPLGAGRFGTLPAALTLREFNHHVKTTLGIDHLQYVGDEEQRLERVAVACGSAAEFLADAARHGCEVLLTGEARFHACLEARSRGMALVLPGHYATERPAVERLAEQIAGRFPSVTCTASAQERDPVKWSSA